MAIRAKGTQLQYEDPATPGTYISIGCVKDISGLGGSTDEIDVTCHDSPGNYKEFLPSLQDGGTVSFDIEFDPKGANHQQLITFKDDATVLAWKIVFPTGDGAGVNDDQADFDGYVNNFEITAPVDGSLMASVAIRVTGAVELTEVP